MTAITPERIERALIAVAAIVEAHGAAALPIFERLERELDEARKRDAPRERARRLLESRTIDLAALGRRETEKEGAA